MHTPRVLVKIHKDEQGLPCIDLDGSSQEAMIMMLQPTDCTINDGIEPDVGQGMALVQLVCGNFMGHT